MVNNNNITKNTLYHNTDDLMMIEVSYG